jgi:hypothetical protein
MLFDILQLSGRGVGVVRRVLIHHHDDPSAGPPRATHQLLQEDLRAPGSLAWLNMVEEQPSSVAERPENGLLAIDAGGVNPLLSAPRASRPSQVQMQEGPVDLVLWTRIPIFGHGYG